MHGVPGPAKALSYVEEILNILGDQKVLQSFYFEYGRGLFTLQVVSEFCSLNSIVVDLGASPSIVSRALTHKGYKVLALDYDPEEYYPLASACGVKVVKADLKRGKLELPGQYSGIIFIEILDHLNPYFANSVMAEVNRVLDFGEKLVLTIRNPRMRIHTEWGLGIT